MSLRIRHLGEAKREEEVRKDVRAWQQRADEAKSLRRQAGMAYYVSTALALTVGKLLSTMRWRGRDKHK